jgi:hypothetical protein
MMLRILMLLSFALLSCTNDPARPISEIYPYHLELLSDQNNVISLYLDMEIGPDGCHGFKESRIQMTGDTERVRFFAEDQSREGFSCTTAFVYLHDTLNVQRLQGAAFMTITMHDGRDTTIALSR